VLTGKDPAFCSGANVRRFNQAIEEREAAAEQAPDEPPLPSAWERMEARWTSQGQADRSRFLPLRLHNIQKPTIAAVNGFAMGVGMGIAISCDIRVASTEAGFSEAFIRNGLIPADGSCWQLPRMIGLGNTLLLQYTGVTVPAEEAYRMGMVNRVVPHEDLMPATMDLAQRLAHGPTYSMSLIKWLVHKSLYTDLEESLRISGAAQSIARETEDHKEGVRAFLEKRDPEFKGR
jgi:2-(1,2-epoxy-1,2-dihydrophenyl)acetyl-CoA isomerase